MPRDSVKSRLPHTALPPQQTKTGFAGAPGSAVMYVGTWLSLVEHSLGVRGVGSSNLPVPTSLHTQVLRYHAPRLSGRAWTAA